MALFEFKLKDIVDVMPWGDENQKRLHWFGLTDGYFYMNVGSEKLFHSTNEILEYWKSKYPEFVPKCNFVDYQVVRPYEDLLQILPDILQPIPDHIFKYIKTSGYQAQLENCLLHYWDHLDDDAEPSDEYYEATEWLGLRHLSTLHLSQGPNIWFLLNKSQLLVRWDNNDKQENGIPLWSSMSGEIRIQLDEFINKVNDFHERLMGAMEKRIEILHENNPIPDIEIDLKRLVEEHQERKLSLQKALGKKPATKNWDVVQNAIREFALA